MVEAQPGRAEIRTAFLAPPVMPEHHRRLRGVPLVPPGDPLHGAHHALGIGFRHLAFYLGPLEQDLDDPALGRTLDP